MLCKNCGTELAENAKFCVSCGSKVELEAEQAIPETPVEPAVEAAPEAVDTVAAEASVEEAAAPKENPIKALKEKLAPAMAKVKPLIQKHKLVLAGVGCVLLLVVAIAIIASVFGGGNGYIAVENAIINGIDEDQVMVIWNNKLIYTDIETDYSSDSADNIDGTVQAFLTSNDELCVAVNKKVYSVAEDVSSFVLSVDGKGIVYVMEEDDEYSLKLYNVSKKKSVTIAEDCSEMAMNYYGYAISPDGKSVAYFDFDEEEFEATLMFFNGKKSIKITSSEVELIGLSNGGKYIYVTADNDGEDMLYTYNKKGDRNKIGTCTDLPVYFNADHTQIMYVNDGKTYVSVNGKTPNKACSGTARLVMPSNSQSISQDSATTYPVENLYDHTYRVYSDGRYNIWTLKKNSDKNVKLVSDVTNWTLDAECEYLYYIDDGDLYVLKLSHGDHASDRAKKLAEDVENYVVTSNRKKVYYVSDEALYSCNASKGTGKKTVASEDVSEDYLILNAKDVLYYVMDGDIYACSNGRKGTKVLTEAEGLLSYRNGVVYAADEDSLYVSTGAKKFTKLYDKD